MTFASGPALVKWPQHLQQEHGDCQRKFGLILSSSTPPRTIQPLPLTFSPSLSCCHLPSPLSNLPASLSIYSALKFTNPSGLLLCTSLFFCFSRTFVSGQERGKQESPTNHNSEAHVSLRRLLCNHYISGFATCVTPERRQAESEEVIQEMIGCDFCSGQTATCVRAV